MRDCALHSIYAACMNRAAKNRIFTAIVPLRGYSYYLAFNWEFRLICAGEKQTDMFRT
ncbi:hypothetical protein BpJC4_18710 [Weizmannia acidilactici]|nr:hypothetical protein BpJC4_18710 [Weizmannia acidilactici]GER72600.1 hypothetical protein BpPP18_06670 [Weizmannia acidilactici]